MWQMLNSDFRYLRTNLPHDCGWSDDGRFLGFVLRKFGEQNVTEGLRRIHRQAPVSAAYFYGVVKNVAEQAGMS